MMGAYIHSVMYVYIYIRLERIQEVSNIIVQTIKYVEFKYSFQSPNHLSIHHIHNNNNKRKVGKQNGKKIYLYGNLIIWLEYFQFQTRLRIVFLQHAMVSVGN